MENNNCTHVFNLAKKKDTGLKILVCYKCGFTQKAFTQSNKKVFKSEGQIKW